ncbi:hypothetical protein QC762_100205 [Podospora pseudocomata]|uniref:Uncharacterized protein n=1 Tax=Podospora pseudocomata TaxID=2093779 RepID=A0ABR0GRB6_9PEZI|nr:hypothetical protein QC762_100205 [Podospora pseudocomata]
MDRGAFCRFMLDARDFLNEAQSAAVPMHVEEDLLRGIVAAGVFSSGGDDHDIAFRFAHCFAFSAFFDIHRLFSATPDVFEFLDQEVKILSMDFNTAYDVRQDFEALFYQQEDKQARS